MDLDFKPPDTFANTRVKQSAYDGGDGAIPSTAKQTKSSAVRVVDPANDFEAMDVDEEDDKASDGDDLYFSDSDAEFVDAESDTLSTPATEILRKEFNGASGNDAIDGRGKDGPVATPVVNLNDGLLSREDASQKIDFSPHDNVKQYPTASTDRRLTVDVGDRDAHRRYQSNTKAPLARKVPSLKQSLDLVDSIKGLYRILDLISERGSGGLVDKVIIDQNSTGRFINELCPGAYKDLTKVDFKAMDEVNVKPLGVYGSKSAIVRFLLEMGAIDDHIAKLLSAPQGEDASTVSPSLRSGLYALMAQEASTVERRLFIIFWPEDATWNDNAISTVRRNRITFMRYLTKITDQIMVLISEDHDRALVWDDPESAGDDSTSVMAFDDLEEETDRLFAFEVSKASEQEENVTFHEAIKIKSPLIKDTPVSEASVAAAISESRLNARLIAGDTKQALLTMAFIPSRQTRRSLCETYTNLMRFRDVLFDKDIALHLNKDISHGAISILVKCGLAQRYPEAVSAFDKRERESEARYLDNRRTRIEKITRDLEASEPRMRDALGTYFVKKVLNVFPKLNEAVLRGTNGTELPSKEVQDADQDFIINLLTIYPTFEQKLEKEAPDINFKGIDGTFTKAMRKILICSHLFSHNKLSERERESVWDLVDSGVESGSMKAAEKFLKDDDAGVLSNIVRGVHKLGRSLLNVAGTSFEQDGPVKDARDATRHLKAIDFFAMVDGILEDWPVLEPGIRAVFNIANEYFAKRILVALRSTPHKLVHEQVEYCKPVLEQELGMSLSEEQKSSRAQLLFDLEKAYFTEGERVRTILLDDLERVPYTRMYSENYRATGSIVDRSEPSLKYTIHPLELTEEDKHQIKMDSAFIPKPKLSERGAYSFGLQLGSEIRLIRLLSNDKCLAVVEGRDRDLYVYLESANTLGAAIASKRHTKHINREKTGHDIALAYDEGKRTLVICGVDAQKPLVQLYYFVFDERYQSLQAQGSAINLTAWYTPEIPKISEIHIISGSDELALLEDTGKLRVFSTVTQQFRPAFLQLRSSPSITFGTPDGSCFGAICPQDGESNLRIYHWASMGSHEGFAFTIPRSMSSPPMLSALDEKKNVHLFTLNTSDNICQSIRINITRPVTEFQFREKNSKNSTQAEARRTSHNSLIDCHSDVWTRFPVVPAVRRQAIMSSELRKGRSLCFVTASQSRIPFKDYFQDLIQKFERSTKKPTATFLSDISVLTRDFRSAISRLRTVGGSDSTSVYKAGEWIVDIFCLIPIHIAIARDNRFIPLKDGVWAPEVEKSLLGADVGRVADSLSFGWYESIFQSYMSTKHVKVVSSMGEQSVGKSFALNHLADTSFAGSAMRTTEGVWMAVTPTESDLIVALDFEGVHSIERSAQEDTLLVLFNAAISNLVLFRNNFALSRDITNLFQSFQSSSSILDPDANRSLFQSTLVIIIKDVVDSDRIEIAREFKLKLHKIVQEEQASNFISRLYRGRLNIIPWPVIESRQFYTLFMTLKKHLDSQSPTHEGGGTFLLKLKMLMAKLKTNDWGSLSQNMATHRAQHLLSLLSRALSCGATELEPDVEPLKNFDTSYEIEAEDSNAIFWLSTSAEHQMKKEEVLRDLFHLWPDFETRHRRPDNEWIGQLCSYLQTLVDQRVAHVQAWVDSNLSQFSGSNAAIEELRRALDAKAVEVKRSVQLCKTQCERCHLLCVGTQFHEGTHDCSTNHTCPNLCQFVDEHEGSPDACSLVAGHEGLHICDPMAHLCGHQCDLNERKGCQGNCTKVANHDEAGHLCSARRHLCGESCSLRRVKTPDGKSYTCQGTCSALWDDEHDTHICDAMSCPIACQLCGRLCASTVHLHGVQHDAVHLCGQEHKCANLCTSKGVCEIDTIPQSIEATFSGAHDRFQYTKYSQATKRLQCAMVIAPGLLAHDGPHVHSTAANPFHYCDTRCDNCGYVCTLPQGHPQPEHSTNHGSMARTRWVVDGPNGSALELDGHKFGSNDDGAPMLCNLVCSAMDRHAHIDYCRASDPNTCSATETDHIKTRIEPDPDRPKDWISHKLYWRRLGFKDPYSREEQANFAKCDAMCCGPEHQATATNAAQPSFCTLPIFHQPAVISQAQSGGHISNDGHLFLCKNPAVLTQAFHVIFVIDRSGSMSIPDRLPLANYPASARIARVANNRLGAVYSALHSFWSARATAMTQASAQARRDAYSAVLFNGSALEIFSNDFRSSPDALLDNVLRYPSDGGTNFSVALSLTEQIMTRHWSTERAPIVIFLSDGECSVTDNVVYSLCRKAVSLGRALSFQAVSFGPDGSSTWLRRMVQIAKEVQDRAPRDPLLPANATVESSYSVALDSVRLAETFLGIAESLRKTRGGLIR